MWKNMKYSLTELYIKFQATVKMEFTRAGSAVSIGFAVIWWYKLSTLESLLSERFNSPSPRNPNGFRLLRPHNYGCNLPETGFHEDSVATYRLRGTRASANKPINKILTAQASHAVMHHFTPPRADIKLWLTRGVRSWDFSGEYITRESGGEDCGENSTQSRARRAFDWSVTVREDSVFRSGFPACDRSAGIEIKCRSNGLKNSCLESSARHGMYIKTTRSSIFS